MSGITIGVKLTPPQYAAEGGARCPVCLSENIHGQDVEMDNGRVYQNCDCLTCNHGWVDVYVLEGYDSLEDNDVLP